jgi:hypothetical protein
MQSAIKRYPEIEEYLDDSDKYQNSATEFKQGNERFLLVTQRGIDGQQLLFKWNGDHFEYWDNETIIDSRTSLPGGFALRPLSEMDATLAQCGPSSESDHKKVYDYVVSKVNKFSSKTGPDHGNLACVWTVRDLVFNALNRWITKTDGTAVSAKLRTNPRFFREESYLSNEKHSWQQKDECRPRRLRGSGKRWDEANLFQFKSARASRTKLHPFHLEQTIPRHETVEGSVLSTSAEVGATN